MTAKRNIYKLELHNKIVYIYKQGVVGCIAKVYKDETIEKGAGLTSLKIPQYIIDESIAIIGADEFEINRGYTYSGQSINIGLTK